MPETHIGLFPDVGGGYFLSRCPGHCFHPDHLGRNATQSETVEGIRALAVDKGHTPRWNPARIEGVTPAMVAPFFNSPWTPETHPLRALN